MEDRSLKTCDIAKTLSILNDQFQNILHENLGMNKMNDECYICSHVKSSYYLKKQHYSFNTNICHEISN